MGLVIMTQTNKNILIGDNSLSFGVACATQLETFDMGVVKVEKDMAKIFGLIQSTKPDVIVLDNFFQHNILVDVISRIKSIEGYFAKIVIAECYQNSNASKEALAQSVDLYVNFPVDVGALCENIVKLTSEISTQPTHSPSISTNIKSPINSVVDLTDLQDDLEVIVTEVILLIGIPAHVKGYHYIRSAIISCIEEPNMLNSVTKILYPTVAKKFETSASRVERAIRHAIEIAWDRGDIDTLNSYFGYTINNQRGKPTNSEFIAMVSDKLRLKFKHLLTKE